ncbi:natural killer cells antigen CD94-like [Pteropus medius]|uniref:natural killer cells antigen CD94-like n=1 Tax=Pteropus vampyrus TaxID=132908 RepID=UPI00196B865F|nr:natural killer cells antigen CD94-like [Pteropus giganteus]
MLRFLPPAHFCDLTTSSWNKHTVCLICVDVGTPFLMAGFQTSPWRLISGILGVMCLVLMATLGKLLNDLFTQQSIQQTPSPGPTLEPQKGRFHALENLSVSGK